MAGARIMNPRGGPGSNPDYTLNYAPLHFLTIFETNGQTRFNGSATPYAYGQLIDTALAGATTVTLSTGEVSQMVVGKRATIYGYARQDYGFPPNPVYFETVTVRAIADQTITIDEPLRYSYHSDWPSFAATGDFTGPPRMLSHSRPDFEEIDSIEINELVLAANPAWTGQNSSVNRNGRLSVGGYRTCNLRGMKIEGGLYVYQGDSFWDYGSSLRGSAEVDKLVTNATFDAVNYFRIEGGSGCRNLTIRNSNFCEIANLQAIDNLAIDGVRTARTAGGATGTAVITDTMGVRNLTVLNSSFCATMSANIALFANSSRFATFSPVDADTIDLPLADFVSSALYRNIWLGSILYNAAGLAMFVCTESPRESAGRVFINGRYIRPISADIALYVPIVENVRAANNSFFGPYARAITNFTAPGSGPMLTDVQDDSRTLDRWAVDSTRFPANTTSRYFHLGPSIQLTRVWINVSKAYTGSSSPAVLLLRRSPSGSNLAQINLKEVGLRLLDLSSTTGAKTGDTLQVIGTDPIYTLLYYTTSNVTYTTESEEAVWTVEMNGIRN